MLHLKKINKSARLGYMCRKEAEYMLHLLISLLIIIGMYNYFKGF